jgi:hypothetical protein
MCVWNFFCYFETACCDWFAKKAYESFWKFYLQEGGGILCIIRKMAFNQISRRGTAYFNGRILWMDTALLVGKRNKETKYCSVYIGFCIARQ